MREDYVTIRNHINKHLRAGGQVDLAWHHRPSKWAQWDTEHVIDGARIRRGRLQVREVSQMTSIRHWKPWRDDEYEVRYTREESF